MRVTRAALLLLLVFLLPACGKSRGSSSPPPPEVSSEPVVPPGSGPPANLVWNVGFTENVPLSEMQAHYAKFVQLSQDLWNLTEGQVCLSKVRFFDNAAPGAEASSSETLQASTLDLLIFPEAKWDLFPVLGQVLFFSPPGTLGRTDRRIDVPDTAARLTLLHEGSHFVWRLSWSGNGLPPGLDDEYVYSPDDSACVMDLRFSPLRWCSGGSQPSANHTTKSGGQGAQSCWEQIRLDYPDFNFAGISRTMSPLPPLAVEYNDTP